MKAINSQMKLVALSVSLLMSVDAMAGLGGLRVNSSLGQPFSASVVVTGDEAKEVLNGGKVNLSDSRLRASVQKSGNNAVITLRSSSAINDPVMIFQMGVGSQARQYTAIIDPPGYRSSSPSRSVNINSNSQADNGNGNGAQSPAPARPSNQATPSNNSRMPVLVQSQQQQVPQPVVAPSSSDTTTTAEATPSTAPSAAAKSEASRQPAAPSKPKRGSRYQAKSGETLNAIAARVRPSGLSLEETKRAIIRANPHLFRKGNVNRALTGANVYIPTTAELNRLGRRPVQAPATAAAGAAAGAAAMAVAPHEATASETTASAPAAAVASAAPVTTASAPVAAASAATPATASAASAVAASAAASEAVASEASVVAPPAPAPVAEQPPVAETSEDLIPWQALVFGGVGVGALLVFLWALSKRKGGLGKKRAQAKENEETDPFQGNDNKAIRTHQPVANPSNPPVTLTKEAAAAQMAAQAAKEAEADKDDFGDFDDDGIFFEEMTKVEDAKSDFDDFDFSSLDLDKQQSGIVSSSITNDKETQNRKNLDWDKVESTESVYEPDDLDDFKPISPAHKPADSVSLSKPAASPTSIASDEFNIDDLDIDINQSMPTAHTSKPAASKAVTPAIETDDISFSEPVDFSRSDDLSFTSSAKPVVEESKEPERMSWASSVPREPAKPVFFDLTKESPEPIVIQTANSAAPAKPVAPEAVKETVEVKPVATPEIAPVGQPAAPAFEVEEKPAATLNFDSLEAFDLEPKPAVPAVELEEKPAATPNFDSLEAFDLEPKPAVPTVELEEKQSVAPVAAELDVLEWDAPSVAPAAQPVVEPVAAKPAAPALDFEVDIPEIPEPVSIQAAPTVAPIAQPVVEPVAAKPAAPALDFEVDIPEIPEPVSIQAAPSVTPTVAPAAPQVAPTIATIDDNDIAGFSLLDEPAQVAPVAAPAQAATDNTLSWSSSEDIGLVDVPAAPVVEWNDIQVEVGSATVADPGFVSESVGMTAPLEAKYELAEMYIEIGDPDAARETLLELIEESTGEIQAKSQALLNTLD